MELKKSIIAVLICVCSVMPFRMEAQQTIVKTSIDSTSILIGQQTFYHVEVITDQGKKIEIPVLTDTLTAGVGILQISKPDTTDIGNNRWQIKQDYLITSFDSAVYIMHPVKVIDGMDTIISNSPVLKVSTYPIESEEFYDIKEPLKPPFYLSDYYVYIYSVLGALLLLCIVMYILQQKRRKVPVFTFKKREPELPPHIKALIHLDDIKTGKLWQQGKIKEYHTEVADTIRKYIEERFGINALEMTSGEILQSSYRFSDGDSAYNSLKQILQLADFVKFAKYSPLPDENEMTLMNAYLYVNQTKIEEKPVMDEEKEPDQNAEKTKIE